jgi:GNAT superfamily N-acetyltransferase
MADVLIRKASPEDVDGLLELYRQLASSGELPNAGNAAMVIELIDSNPWMLYLVAELDDVVVGTVTMVIVPAVTHSAQPWAQIEHMVVHEAHRKTGIGHALLARCEEHIRSIGGYKMQLQSSNQRDDAHEFYEREGFSASSVGYQRYL